MIRSVRPRTRAAWRAWLLAHHGDVDAVIVAFAKQSSKRTSVSYVDAVEQALCFGWIDGVKTRIDDDYYAHRFTPRTANSKWSALNKQRIERLIAAGQMHASGQAVIDAARASGAWDRPARAVTPATMPAELTAALGRSARARAAFTALAPSHQRNWQRWIHDAKLPETRARRAAKAIAELASGKRGGPAA